MIEPPAAFAGLGSAARPIPVLQSSAALAPAPLALRLRLPVVPAPGETISVVCSLSAFAQFEGPAQFSVTAGSALTLPLQVRVGRFALGEEQDVVLQCVASSNIAAQSLYRGVQPATAHLRPVPTRWPLVTDILRMVPGRGWLSSWLRDELGSASGNASEVVPLSVSRVGVPLSGQPLTLTIQGSVELALAGAPGAFALGASVWLGTTECDVTGVSADGRFLRLRVPPYAVLCRDATCPGYLPLRVQNPVRSGLLVTRDSSSNDLVVFQGPDRGAQQRAERFATQAFALPLAANETLGGVTVCPSDCPGSAAGLGLYVTQTCDGFESEPSVCMDKRKASQCGVGQGNQCRSCPSGAVCPGGQRIWPQPGFWSGNEAAAPSSCPPPAQGRCVGWDGQQTICGVGYR